MRFTALIEEIPVRARRAAFSVAVCCVTFASWWPKKYTEVYVADPFHRHDDITHAVIYAVLAAVTLAAWGCKARAWRSRWAVWLGAAFFGLIMEIGQETLPGVNRTFQVSDLVSNAVGALIGGALCLPRFWPMNKH